MIVNDTDILKCSYNIGDTFIVLFDPVDEIVQCVTAVAPYVDRRVRGEAKIVEDHMSNPNDGEEGGDYETKYAEEYELQSAAYRSHVGTAESTAEKKPHDDTSDVHTSNDCSSTPCKCGPFTVSCNSKSSSPLFFRIAIKEPVVSNKSTSPVRSPIFSPSRKTTSAYATPPPNERVKLPASDRYPSVRKSPSTHGVDSKHEDLTGINMLSALCQLRTSHSIGTLSNAW